MFKHGVKYDVTKENTKLLATYRDKFRINEMIFLCNPKRHFLIFCGKRGFLEAKVGEKRVKMTILHAHAETKGAELKT